ncbi:amiloride-sensitive sodium channel subunit delta [Pseudophryne corroboree]|uniref:amiloride-sensitive sodium channel subunit delta n=1 Tax=Pseudophryne corroboree TaxID=495146 RepID=UPI003081B154
MEDTDSEKTEDGWFEFYESFHDLFEFFCDNTTIHGTVRLNCSRRNAMKTSFWVVLFFCSFGMMYWQFGQTVHEYWNYPTNIAILLQSNKNIFPAVTVCNLNPYRFDQVNEYLNQLDDLTKQTLSSLYGFNATLHKNTDNETIDLESILGSVNSSNTGSFRLDTTIKLERMAISGQNQTVPGKKHQVGYKLCNSTGGDCYYRSFWSGVDALQEWYKFHFMNIMSKIPLVLQIPDEKFMEKFILTCDFDGNPCQREYTHFHHPTYGACFTIKANQNTSSFGMTVKTGKQNGLSMTVTTDQTNNMPVMSTAAGAMVLIHNSDQPPLVEHEGFDIFPGTEISISIRQDQVNRLGEPYSACTNDESKLDFRLLYNSSYTLQACLQSCFQYKMIEQCGCGYYFYPLLPGMEYCDYNKHPGWGHCFYRLYDKLLDHRLICFTKCPKQCSETMYYLSAGSARWPSTMSKAMSLASLTNGYLSHSRSSVSRINVYFQELSHRTFAETPAINIHDLLSTMGNQWSFWFGSSVLSVAELAELVFDVAAMLMIIGYSKYGKKRGDYPDNAPPYVISVDGISDLDERSISTVGLQSQADNPLPTQDPDRHNYPEDKVDSKPT